MPAHVTLSDGTVVTPGVMPDTIPNVGHTVADQLAAMNIQHGIPQMNGWQNITDGSCDAAAHYQCISGYKPRQVPNLTSLAQKFAISDMTFSMADSPSWGGHLYAVMGSLDGFTGDNPNRAKGVPPGRGWGCDSNRVTPWVGPGGHTQLVPSCVPDYSLGLANGGAFRPTPAAYHATIFDELHSAGLSWRIYGATAPMPQFFGGGYDWSICPSLAECLDTSQHNNLVDSSQFFTAANSGKLPAFSIVTAGGSHNAVRESCHNQYSMTACDNYIGKLVSAVEQGPDWSSSAIFITFDDFGGFYDQVPPGLNPDKTQRGPRSPLIVVSPYAKARYTDTTATTFAGILAYTEQNFGLAPLGPNDKGAYPFTDAFNYSQTPLKPVRMVHRALPASAKRIRITPAMENDPS
jgi:phospholipase C